MGKSCVHKDEVRIKTSDATTCPDCVARGDRWVHLRMCLICGYVGCCDSSVNRHAHKHYETSGHRLIRSLEPGEEWGWCYDCEAYLRVR